MFHRTHVKDGKKLTGAAAEEAKIKEFVDNDSKCQFVVQQAELNKEFKDEFINNYHDIKNIADILRTYDSVVLTEESDGVFLLDCFDHHDKVYVKNVLNGLNLTYKEEKEDKELKNSPIIGVW